MEITEGVDGENSQSERDLKESIIDPNLWSNVNPNSNKLFYKK